MHQELSKKNQLSLVKLIVCISIAFISLNVLNYIGSSLNFNTTIMDIIVIVLVIILCVFIFRRCCIVYKYKVIGEEFIINEIVGNKEKLIVNINTSQIIKIESINSNDYREDRKKKYEHKQILHNGLNKLECFYCIYEDNHNKYYLEFEPSQKMLNLLRKKNEK
jgi:hypothetical protein